MAEWTHTICEVCWFGREPNRYPVQVIREEGDREVDACCFCGSMKVTRIYVREDPKAAALKCGGVHEEIDEEQDVLGDVPESG